MRTLSLLYGEDGHMCVSSPDEFANKRPTMAHIRFVYQLRLSTRRHSVYHGVTQHAGWSGNCKGGNGNVCGHMYIQAAAHTREICV